VPRDGGHRAGHRVEHANALQGSSGHFALHEVKEECSFLKKRTKKLLRLASAGTRHMGQRRSKSLLLLFFKKEDLPSSPVTARAAPSNIGDDIGLQRRIGGPGATKLPTIPARQCYDGSGAMVHAARLNAR
jgi:hypothetical protein